MSPRFLLEFLMRLSALLTAFALAVPVFAAEPDASPLKKGEKIAHGTLAEVSAQFSHGEAAVSLEEVFLRATGGSEN